MDQELHELSKEVYRRHPDWTSTGYIYYQNRHYKALQGDYDVYAEGYAYDMTNGYTADFEPERGDIPLYSCDYLLARLPKKFREKGTTYWVEVSPMDMNTWGACYAEDRDDELKHFVYSDTPLKALLKLTIALDDAGVTL